MILHDKDFCWQFWPRKILASQRGKRDFPWRGERMFG
jgi:hypothetical protein